MYNNRQLLNTRNKYEIVNNHHCPDRNMSNKEQSWTLGENR